MPIEARMAGMFGGFLIGIAYFIIIGRGRAWRMPDTTLALILIGFIALLGMDGVNAMFYDLRLPHLYLPNLYFRLGTGLLTGLALAGFMLPAFNSTLRQTGVDVHVKSDRIQNGAHVVGTDGWFFRCFLHVNFLHVRRARPPCCPKPRQL